MVINLFFKKWNKNKKNTDVNEMTFNISTHVYFTALACSLTCLLTHSLIHLFTLSWIKRKKKILPDLGRAKVVGLGWVEGETKIHIIYKVNNRHEYYATQSKSKIQTILLLNITLPSIF